MDVANLHSRARAETSIALAFLGDIGPHSLGVIDASHADECLTSDAVNGPDLADLSDQVERPRRVPVYVQCGMHICTIEC